MPIEQGYEQFRGKHIGYYRAGITGKKYHYTIYDDAARKRAKAKA